MLTDICSLDVPVANLFNKSGVTCTVNGTVLLKGTLNKLGVIVISELVIICNS